MNNGHDRSALAFDRETVDRVGEGPFFRTLVEKTTDGIVTIDEANTIVCANPAFEDIFGYEPRELVGSSFLSLVPQRLREWYSRVLHHYLETGERPLSGEYLELLGLHRDGHEVELALSLREHGANGRRLFTGSVRDVTDRKEGERRLEQFNTIVETVGDSIYQLDIEGRFVTVNDVVVDVTGYSRDELIGESVSKILDDEDIAKSVEVVRELLADDEKSVGVVEMDIHTANGGVIPAEDRIALVWSGGELQGTVGVVRDISDRKRREQELKRQRNDLAELDRINTVIREINRTLVAATTREEIERTVCERLAGSDSYVFAMIEAQRASRQVVEPTVWAGIDDVGPEDVHAITDGNEPERGSVRDAIRSRSVQVVQNVPDGLDDGPSRHAALEHGFRSFAAIPIVYGDTVYGVLSLYADRAYGFTDQEVDVLNELGETIGLAINATESRKLLLSDTAVELEFRLTDDESFFNSLSRQLGCTLKLEGVVPAEENTYLCYVTVTDAAPDAVLDFVDQAEMIRDATVISEHDGESLLSFDVAGSSAVVTLIETGAVVKTAIADDGESVLVVDVAPDADVSSLVDSVVRVFPGLELVAQREVTRPVQTSREFREVVKSRLTDRQRAVLEAAYRGGYFARPRDITGSDLAESFGVTPSTFHHHLQTALNKVAEAVFEDRISA